MLVVDGHQLVGSALAACLRAEGLDARFHPVGSAAAVLEVAGCVPGGVVLLELDLGRDVAGARVDAVGLVGPLCAAGWRVVVLTGQAGGAQVGAALRAGALGWIPKTVPLAALLGIVGEALAGREIMSRSRRRQLIDLHLRCEHERGRLQARWATLTGREREVLALLAAGRRAPAIAEQFVVAPATVRTQIQAVLTKLGVSSQLEAVALYQRVRRR